MNQYLFKMLTLDGGKTYVAGALLVGFGIYQLIIGNQDDGMVRIAEGLAILGIGRKVTKNTEAVETANKDKGQ